MTVHTSKGLEFGHVYIVGMEENLFPSVGSTSDETEVEEERRLFYVALTRAEKSVKLSFAHSRMKWGTHVNNRPSRFLKEIDKVYILNPLTDFEEELHTKFNNGPDRFGGRSSGISSRPSGISARPSGMVSRPVGTGLASRPAKAPDPNFVADSPSKIAAGQTVEHDRFGIGVVVSIEGDPLNLKAVVDFKEGGRKTLLLKFAKIRIIVAQ
jgi:DNA helicase-2/ATP-dependent DNA helicase PcrA